MIPAVDAIDSVLKLLMDSLDQCSGKCEDLTRLCLLESDGEALTQKVFNNRDT